MKDGVEVSKYLRSGRVNPVWFYVVLNQEKTIVVGPRLDGSFVVPKSFMAEWDRARIKGTANAPPTHIPSPRTGVYSMVIHPVEREIFTGGLAERIYKAVPGFVGKTFSPQAYLQQPIMDPYDRPGGLMEVDGIDPAMDMLHAAFPGITLNHVSITHGISHFEPGHGPGSKLREDMNKVFVLFLHDPGVRLSLEVWRGDDRLTTWRVDHGMILVWSAQDNDAGLVRKVIGRCVCVTFRTAERYSFEYDSFNVLRWTPTGYVQHETATESLDPSE